MGLILLSLLFFSFYQWENKEAQRSGAEEGGKTQVVSELMATQPVGVQRKEGEQSVGGKKLKGCGESPVNDPLSYNVLWLECIISQLNCSETWSCPRAISCKKVNLMPVTSLSSSGKLVVKPESRISEPKGGKWIIPTDTISAPGSSYTWGHHWTLLYWPVSFSVVHNPVRDTFP